MINYKAIIFFFVLGIWMASDILLLIETLKSPHTKQDWLIFFPILWLLFNWCGLPPLLHNDPNQLVFIWRYISRLPLYLVFGVWLWADLRTFLRDREKSKFLVRPITIVVHCLTMHYIWTGWIEAFAGNASG